MDGFLSWLGDIGQSVLQVLDKLPKSPFSYLDSLPEVTQYLGYVNYFIPIYAMISIFEAWLIAIGLYYAVSIVLRWIKAID